MTLYALVAASVYDQGIVGVYDTEEQAYTAAAEIWPQTDGHHGFRIDVVELNRTYENVFPYVYLKGTDAWPPKRPVPVEVYDRTDKRQ